MLWRSYKFSKSKHPKLMVLILLMAVEINALSAAHYQCSAPTQGSRSAVVMSSLSMRTHVHMP